MREEPELLNPYAPPGEVAQSDSAPPKHIKLWREGERLMIRNGAEFPPVCFVTGIPTSTSVVVHHIWQPAWVYLLLFPFIIPYFLVSPFLHRKITLDLPLAEVLYRPHQKLVNRGFKLILLGVSLFVVWLFLPSFLGFQSTLFIAGSIGCILAGLILASRQPVRLSVERFRGDTLVLRNAHRLFLERVPSPGAPD